MRKYSILLIIFALIEIGLALYLTVWREHFWNAVSAKQSLVFAQQLVVFLLAALGCCFVSGVSGYLISLTTIKWREKLNTKAFLIRESRIDCVDCLGTGHDAARSDSWKCYTCAGKGAVAPKSENFNQRMQEDCSKYPELVLTLGFGLCKAIMYIVVFSVSLMLSFHWQFLFILIGYSVVGSIVASYVAKPLIKLNYEQQRAEATYRNNLSIDNFKDCLLLMLGIAKRTKKLTYFQQFYLQIAVVVPLLIIAPIYFNSSMTVGMLMRFNSVGNTLLDNMNYGISSWGQLNMLMSCRKRLKEIKVI